MTQQIRIGVAGLGLRGKWFLRELNDRLDVALVAMADTNDDTLLEYKTQYPHVVVYHSVERMVHDADIEAVIIATPDYLHRDHGIAALEAGKHVFMEKPLATTPTDCSMPIESAEASGHTLYVGHNLRHFTVIKKLKQLIDEG